MKVSVIVPVYNTSKYLRRCADHLVNQTLDEIEIIFINDGSTDNSLSILNEYKEKYPSKVFVYSKSDRKEFTVDEICPYPFNEENLWKVEW